MLRASESEMGITDPYVSVVDKAFEDHAKTQLKGPIESFRDMSDEDINRNAQVFIDQYELPYERIVHIINEMKSYRFFSSFGNTEEYEVLVDLRHSRSDSTKYACPSSYIIRSKLSGLESMASSDLEKLAANFGALKT